MLALLSKWMTRTAQTENQNFHVGITEPHQNHLIILLLKPPPRIYLQNFYPTVERGLTLMMRRKVMNEITAKRRDPSVDETTRAIVRYSNVRHFSVRPSWCDRAPSIPAFRQSNLRSHLKIPRSSELFLLPPSLRHLEVRAWVPNLHFL